MKKRIPFLAALAISASVMAFAVGCDDHEHVFEMKPGETQHYLECTECGKKKDFADHVYSELEHDDDVHWYECECGAKKDEGAHVDEVINETGAAGKDGKCDVCGVVSKYAVTFAWNMQDVTVELPAAQSVEHGAKASKPFDPVVPTGHRFMGWFTTADGTTAFDFANDQITDTTTVFGVWEYVDGFVKETAIELEKDDDTGVTIGAFQKIYLKYTAPEEGRLKVSLLGATSQKCSFTTSIDNNAKTYKGSDEFYFDVAAEDTVYFTVIRGAGVADTNKITLLLSDSTDEPLPAEGWASGSYENENYETDVIVFDRATKTLTVSDNPHPVRYIGGSNPYIYYTMEMPNWDGTVSKIVYKFTQPEEGVLRRLSTYAGGRDTDFRFVVYPDPIDVEKFAGIYRSNDAADNGMPTEFGIYASGNSYYISDGDRFSEQGTLDKKNRLSCGGYKITVTLDASGNAVSINVKNYSGSYEYTRASDIGNEPPESISEITGKEYHGATCGILNDGYLTWLDERSESTLESVKVWDYDDATEMYTVKKGDTFYRLKVVERGDEEIIELYDETGATKVDTLEPFTFTFHEIGVTDTEQTFTISSSEFIRGYYFYRATATGWYKFVFSTSSSGSGEIEGKIDGEDDDNENDDDYTVYPEIYYDLDEDDPTTTWSGKLARHNASVYIEEGSIIAISISNFQTAPESVSFSLVRGQEPAGYSAENPIEYTGTGVHDFTKPEGTDDQDFYFSIKGLDDGEYTICVYNRVEEYDYDWDETFVHYNHNFFYTIGDTSYGFDPDEFVWTNVESAEPFEDDEWADNRRLATVTVTGGTLSMCLHSNWYTDISISIVKK